MGEYNEKIGRIVIHYHDVKELNTILNIRRIMSEWYSSSGDIHSLREFVNMRIAIVRSYDQAYLIRDLKANQRVIGLQICWLNPVQTNEQPIITVEDIALKSC